MRLLPPTKQAEIMEAVRDYLSTTPFRFERDWAQIITGVEEGIYGWITVNYLLSLFKNNTKSTVGALGKYYDTMIVFLILFLF
jgi:apyrase